MSSAKTATARPSKARAGRAEPNRRPRSATPQAPSQASAQADRREIARLTRVNAELRLLGETIAEDALAAKRERDNLLATRDMLAERVAELTAAGDPLQTRAEYERVVHERDEALKRAEADAATLRDALKRAAVFDDRLARVGYERDCAQDDLAAAEDAIVALSVKAAALEMQLRNALRDRPPYPGRSTYAGPLARPLTCEDGQ